MQASDFITPKYAYFVLLHFAVSLFRCLKGDNRAAFRELEGLQKIVDFIGNKVSPGLLRSDKRP